MKRALPQTVAPSKLNLPTIMDRALAQKHGALYVHLVVFAIDIDRVYTETAPLTDDDLLDPTDPKAQAEQPFGWEVFLTGARLRALDASVPATLAMLEDTCNHVLSQPPEEQGFGSQLVFAVYDAVQRGALPASLGDLFRSWKGKPKQLLRSLDALWKNAEQQLPQLAEHCLDTTLEPPLAPPTISALQAMAKGE